MNKTGYNDKSDVWSLGCLLYEACALAPPFLATNQNALAQKIKIGQFHPIPLHYPKSLSHLITTMLRVDVCYVICDKEVVFYNAIPCSHKYCCFSG